MFRRSRTNPMPTDGGSLQTSPAPGGPGEVASGVMSPPEASGAVRDTASPPGTVPAAGMSPSTGMGPVAGTRPATGMGAEPAMASEPGVRGPATTRQPAAVAEPSHRLGVWRRPVGAAFTGLLALVVGAWAALAGYVGPYFDFRPVARTVWVTSLQNGLLHLLPGAVGAAAGLALMVMGPARRSIRGGSFVLPAAMLIASGAWLVIGPDAWPTLETGSAFLAAHSATRHLLDVACSSYAPGLAMVLLGGMALKAAAVPPVRIDTVRGPHNRGEGRHLRPLHAGLGLAG
jgi:hypothetical protein